jgi:hypothetical protein
VVASVCCQRTNGNPICVCYFPLTAGVRYSAPSDALESPRACALTVTLLMMAHQSAMGGVATAGTVTSFNKLVMQTYDAQHLLQLVNVPMRTGGEMLSAVLLKCERLEGQLHGWSGGRVRSAQRDSGSRMHVWCCCCQAAGGVDRLEMLVVRTQKRGELKTARESKPLHMLPCIADARLSTPTVHRHMSELLRS